MSRVEMEAVSAVRAHPVEAAHAVHVVNDTPGVATKILHAVHENGRSHVLGGLTRHPVQPITVEGVPDQIVDAIHDPQRQRDIVKRLGGDYGVETVLKDGAVDRSIAHVLHTQPYAHVAQDVRIIDFHRNVHEAGFLTSNDPCGVTFWIISIAMVAATVFFLMESMVVKTHWKTSLNVGALVTLVAAVHYFYMREFWIQFHSSPIIYRYIDWSITVPLQMIEFYLILSAVQPSLSGGMFWRLMLGTVAMLSFGYAGESGAIGTLPGFILGVAGWMYILYEIFRGEAAQVAAKADRANKYVKQSYDVMRLIVTVGWSIYPLGYFFGFFLGAVAPGPLNITYNLADFVNKIAFCLAIWHAGKSDTLDSTSRN